MLPQLTLPGGFPLWHIDPHAGEFDSIYADVPMQTGHVRKRRLYTRVPQVREVAIQLNDAQALAFHDWYENDLIAGAREFAAQVQQHGIGLRWYAARFVAPYEAIPINRGRGRLLWRILARLMLTGDGEISGPVLTTFGAEIRVPLVGRATGTTTKVLFAEIEVPLLGASADVRIAAEIAVPVEGAVEAEGVLPLWAEIAVPLASAATAQTTKLLAAEIAVPLLGEVGS